VTRSIINAGRENNILIESLLGAEKRQTNKKNNLKSAELKVPHLMTKNKSDPKL
jgi:hypothetical protein